ncbi:hypothetical protein [Sanyastnella coralliicola]|uniref:hypothetical protein n=1 Tax=Sanyastnella coralliicola TaxID=3069118 RepID=UPI0027BA5BBC|nr:hypothetical protein [Longitalea sp. SCSIO 12813]
MKVYFSLLFKISTRAIRQVGLHPVLGALLAVAAFTTLTMVLYAQTAWAGLFMVLFGVYFQSLLMSTQRTEFLELHFGKRQRQRIRLLENSLVGLPFLIVLLASAEWLLCLLFVAVTCVTSFFSFQQVYVRSIPTPFGKSPYEFVVGFRRIWWVLMVAGVLLAIGIGVDNPNLAVSSVVAIQLAIASFYSTPEPDFFVWNSNRSWSAFLKWKLGVMLKNTSLLIAPFSLVFLLVYPENWWVWGIICAVGILLIALVVLAKYAAFPYAISLPHAVIIALCVSFPPLIPLAAAFLSANARKSLKRYLHDPNQ